MTASPKLRFAALALPLLVLLVPASAPAQSVAADPRASPHSPLATATRSGVGPAEFMNSKRKAPRVVRRRSTANCRDMPVENPMRYGWTFSRERPVTAAGLGTNVRANNRATDIVTCQGPSGPVPCSTQAEESIAAWHQYVLVAWNDGEKADPTTYPPPNNDVQGYGFSTNGGATFTDGGVPPRFM